MVWKLSDRGILKMNPNIMCLSSFYDRDFLLIKNELDIIISIPVIGFDLTLCLSGMIARLTCRLLSLGNVILQEKPRYFFG